MADDDDDTDLPLHDEAMARDKWRGGETLISRGKERLDLPASEVDNAAAPAPGSHSGEGDAADTGPGALGPALRPPD
jgi:hypothetical protein